MMIYHFFSAKYVHLSPTIIKSFLSNASRTNKGGLDDICVVIENTSGHVFEGQDYKKIYGDLASEMNFRKIQIIDNKMKLLFKILSISSNDKIFFHSSQNPQVLFRLNVLIYLFKWKKKAQSINYVCWGDDFVWGIDTGNANSWKNKYKYKIFKSVWPWYKNIITLDKSDKDKVKKIYSSNNIKCISYIGNTEIDEPVKDDSTFKIMVSHSGWQHNKHLEAFKSLSKFKDEKIEIYCPLCYGDPQYINEVIKSGKEIFGEKFNYFTELLSPEEYTQFVKGMHAYVTATDTQTGLGAIERSLEGNAKVYLKEFFYNQFVEKGYKVFHFEDIKNQTFDNLIKPLGNDNLELVKKINDQIFQSSISQWKSVFEE